jgi:hypothetical protein
VAELLVRTEDKPKTGDPYTDRHRSGRGCVIAIQPDGWQWSKAEQSAPFWRIVKLPGIPVEKLTQLTAPDLGYLDPEAEKMNKVLRRYTRAFDLAELDALLLHPTKKEDLKTEAKALPLIQVVAKALPVLVDPAVIGDPPKIGKVIG